MNVSYLEHHLKASGTIPRRIVDERDLYAYVIDQRAKNSINKVLGTTFIAVYRKELYAKKTQMKAEHLSFDCGEVFVVKQDMTVLCFNNSEWFSIRPVESHK